MGINDNKVLVSSINYVLNVLSAEFKYHGIVVSGMPAGDYDNIGKYVNEFYQAGIAYIDKKGDGYNVKFSIELNNNGDGHLFATVRNMSTDRSIKKFSVKLFGKNPKMTYDFIHIMMINLMDFVNRNRNKQIQYERQK